MLKENKEKGKVYIVGSGPGDPFLITLRGLNAIKLADVILYDRLVNPLLLNYAKSGAKKIYVGKEPGKPTFSQEKINELMLSFALEGMRVVRLKGGDPYIFGRGSEEALFLKENKVEFEVIPGVTSALGASAYNGIPLTHRALVAGVIFVTAHEDPTKPESQMDFETLASAKNFTIVVYMGSSNLQRFVNSLISNGFDRNSPAAIVAKATTPRQKSFTAPLYCLPEIQKKENLKSPLVTIISPCANFHKDLNWFEKKPLFGKKVITTRALDQSETLFEKLITEGAEILPFQTFTTEPVILTKNELLEIKAKNFDWIIFTSQNGVRYFFLQLFNNDLDSRFFNNAKIAVLGEKTALEIKKYGIIPDFVPSRYNSNAFIEEYSKNYDISNNSILRIKGNFDKDPISDFLSKSSKKFETLIVYRINRVYPTEEEKEKIAKSNADAVVFTASSTVENFFEILGNNIAKNIIEKAKVFAIGPMTAESLKNKGISNIFVSNQHTIDGIIQLMEQVFSKEEEL